MKTSRKPEDVITTKKICHRVMRLSPAIENHRKTTLFSRRFINKCAFCIILVFIDELLVNHLQFLRFRCTSLMLLFYYHRFYSSNWLLFSHLFSTKDENVQLNSSTIIIKSSSHDDRIKWKHNATVRTTSHQAILRTTTRIVKKTPLVVLTLLLLFRETITEETEEKRRITGRMPKYLLSIKWV
jgi:hypothetical protein